MKLIEHMTNKQIGKVVRHACLDRFCDICISKEACSQKEDVDCVDQVVKYMLETDYVEGEDITNED